MTNQYSIDIHDYVSEKIRWSKEMMNRASEKRDISNKRFYEGQLEEWTKMREYMDRTIDLKTQKYY